jgi:hypothetical protein
LSDPDPALRSGGAGSRLSRLTPASISGIALLASIAANTLSQRLVDLDIWWHLKTGQLTVAMHSIPAGDPYSFTAAGRRWIVQEWGSQVILHGIDSAFGLRGILVWRAAMLVAVYALVARLIIRRAGNTIGAWALVALTAYAGSGGWTERPNLFSFLLFVLTLSLTTRRDRTIWLFVPIAALWANLHGMVVLGLGLVVLLAAAEGLKVLFRWEGADGVWARRLTGVAGAGVLATFLNPYGPGLLAHSYRLVRIVTEFVTEWASPDFHQIVPLLFLLLAAVTIAGLALAPPRADPTDVALTVAFLGLGLSAVRNLPIAAIVLGFVASRYAPAAVNVALAGRRGGGRTRPEVRPPALLNTVALVAVTGVLVTLVATSFPRSGSIQETVDEKFPVASLENLRGEQVRLFTSDSWAGLALYMLWPETRVAFDTRPDFYGRPIIRRYQSVIAGRGDWGAQLSAWCVTHVLVDSRTGLAALVADDAEWTLLRDDPVREDDRLGRALLFRRLDPPAGCP